MQTGYFMKKVADEQEPVVRIPPVVEPVVVEVALRVVPVQNRDIAIAVVQRERACLSVPDTVRITAG